MFHSVIPLGCKPSFTDIGTKDKSTVHRVVCWHYVDSEWNCCDVCENGLSGYNRVIFLCFVLVRLHGMSNRRTRVYWNPVVPWSWKHLNPDGLSYGNWGRNQFCQYLLTLSTGVCFEPYKGDPIPRIPSTRNEYSSRINGFGGWPVVTSIVHNEMRIHWGVPWGWQKGVWHSVCVGSNDQTVLDNIKYNLVGFSFNN